MAVCDYILFDLSASCDALVKTGGLRREYYLARRSDFTFTRAANGSMASITFLALKFLVKGSGRKLSNSGSSSLKRNDNGTRFYDHGVKITIPAITQAERNSVGQLVGPDDIVVFAPNNSNGILIFGLDSGLEVSKLEESTGTKLGDSSDFMAEITGQEPSLPILFEPTAAASFAARLAILQGLTNPSPGLPPPNVG